MVFYLNYTYLSRPSLPLKLKRVTGCTHKLLGVKKVVQHLPARSNCVEPSEIQFDLELEHMISSLRELLVEEMGSKISRFLLIRHNYV